MWLFASPSFVQRFGRHGIRKKVTVVKYSRRPRIETYFVEVWQNKTEISSYIWGTYWQFRQRRFLIRFFLRN